MLLTLILLLVQPFDYYVLSLSWSPEHCSSGVGKKDSQQCGPGRRFGFVVHGLWPQNERGFPEDCGQATPLPAALVDEMLPIMPSEPLIRHEWEKHGTCSGLPADGYFKLIRAAYQKVKVPDVYRQPGRPIYALSEDLKREFRHANPGLTDHSMAVNCSGRYLREVRVCLTKDLELRPCGKDVKDRCQTPEVILRPVR